MFVLTFKMIGAVVPEKYFTKKTIYTQTHARTHTHTHTNILMKKKKQTKNYIPPILRIPGYN